MPSETNCRTIGGVLYPPYQWIYDHKKQAETIEYLGSLKRSPLEIRRTADQPNKAKSIKPE